VGTLSEKLPPSAVPAGRHGGSALLRNLRYLSPTLCIARTNFTLRHSPLAARSMSGKFSIRSTGAAGHDVDCYVALSAAFGVILFCFRMFVDARRLGATSRDRARHAPTDRAV
jgi:hypothetical protein